MSTEVLEKIEKSLARCGLSGKSALAWVSGGVDSVCLAQLFARLKAKGALSGLEIAHVDHGLRPDSGEDAAFVGALAASLGAPFHLVNLTKGDFPGGANVQAAARLARRDKLEALRKARGLACSALAHHADDQSETVLFKLLRGVGPRGAGGMREWSPPLFRPLLGVTKGELLALAKAEGWEYREDPTNAGPKYSRNRVRNELLPLAREIAPGADGALVRYGALAAEDDEYLTLAAHAEFARLAQAEPEGWRFDAQALAALHPSLTRRLLLAAVERLGLPTESLSAAHLLTLLELLEPGKAHRKAPLPGPAVFARSYGDFWVYDPARLKSMAAELEENVKMQGLTPRPRRDGDRLGDKKVKDLLMDARIPRWRRDIALVGEDSDVVKAVFAVGMEDQLLIV